MNRLAVEAIAALVASGALWIAWVTHNHLEQEIGRQQCQRSVAEAYNKGVKAAAAKYAAQIKELNGAVQQYQDAKSRSDAAWGTAMQQLRDYQSLLRAASTTIGPTAAGADPDEAKVLRLRLADFEKFASTAFAIAKDGQDDAQELALCQAYAETVSPWQGALH